MRLHWIVFLLIFWGGAHIFSIFSDPTLKQYTTLATKTNRLCPNTNVEKGFLFSGGSRISPRWCANSPGRGGSNIRFCQILPNFPKNCMKLKEFGPQGRGERASLAPLLDPPLLLNSLKNKRRETWKTNLYLAERAK